MNTVKGNAGSTGHLMDLPDMEQAARLAELLREMGCTVQQDHHRPRIWVDIPKPSK